MKICEKCQSEKIQVEIDNLNKHNDNVIKTYECQECGHKKTEIIHIG